MTYRPR